MNELPKGWIDVAFAEVVEVNPRRSVDLSLDDFVTFVPMAAVDEVSGTIATRIERPVREVVKGFTQFMENDVIFAKITPSMENGKSAVATDLRNGVGFGSTEFHIFRTSGAVLAEYLWRFIRQQTFRDDAQRVMSGAVGQQRVPTEYLRAHRLPLPPLAEQKRILAKVNSLTARTTRAHAELARIPALIEKYRTVLLDLAFSGRLTADIRGETAENTNGPPVSWTRRPLGEIGEIQTGIQVGKKRSRTVDLVEVPYLRVINVQRGRLDLNDIKLISVTREEKNRLLLMKGDLLMNEGGDRDKLGRGWVWDGQIEECIHQNHVFRVRLRDDILPPRFVSHFANECGQQYFFDEGKQTTNLASISKTRVSELIVPVPLYAEAVEILRRVESSFAWLNRVSAEHASASGLLPKLDAAIHAKCPSRNFLIPMSRL